MVCSRGRATPTIQTRYRLFAASAGRCQKPDCLQSLFVDTASMSVHFAEAAHILAASDSGPRAQANLSVEERGTWENLILLCANCHTIVDKAEADFPDDVLVQWKAEHSNKIEEAFGIGRLESRSEGFDRLRRYISRNRTIFETYGPMTEQRFNPESDSPPLWRKHVADTILPNNRAMLLLMDRNRHLLTATEEVVVEQFRIHVSDFERRHLHNPPQGGGRQLPPEVKFLFGEVPDV